MSRPVVCTPLRVEQAALRAGGIATHVHHTGMGGRATDGGQRVPDPATGLLVAGVCGGLSPSLQPGDLVVATEVRGAGRAVGCPSWPLLAGALRRRGLTVHTGPVTTTARLVRDGDRTRLAGTGAVAVDMESAALASGLAAAAGPVAVVRAVADTPGTSLLSLSGARAGWRALSSLRHAAPTLDKWACALAARTVRLAAPRSFCAGVERAIEIVERALVRFPAPVYVRKQIVHNAHVVAELEARGAVFVDELDEVPPGATLVFSAHAVSPHVRAEARRRGLAVVDATCPLVAKVHAEARRSTRDGGTLLLIGHHGHEEVEGTSGEAPGRVVVVDGEAAARTVYVPDPSRVSYLMQTTLAVDEAAATADVLRQRFPAIVGPGSDDICYATTNRQDAVRAIAADSDVVLVVGSRNSSNSLRLAEVAERCGTPAYLVDDVGHVDLRWLHGAEAVGITAGASAPPHLVDGVIQALAGLGPLGVRETSVTTENVRFTMPKEVS